MSKLVWSITIKGTICTILFRPLPEKPIMRKRSGIISITLGIIASIALLLAYYGYSPSVSRPDLSGELRSDTIVIDDIQRSYSFYLPNNLPDQPALVFMLHGSSQSVDDIRAYTAYQFEQLADQHKFILVYPEGYKNNWNDCRKTANYPARAENIDDIKFIKTLMSHFQHRFGSNSTKSFMAGFSNGGHLGFRFALEHPNAIGGIAAISANLPSASNLDCVDKGRCCSGVSDERHRRSNITAIMAVE